MGARVEELGMSGKKRHSCAICYPVIALLALFGSLYIELFIESILFARSGVSSGFLFGSFTAYFIMRWLILFLICSSILYLAMRANSHAVDWIYRHRVLVAAVSVLILSFAHVNYSSVGVWDLILGEKNQLVIWGTPRVVRSDEYGVSTLFNFSQSQNGFLPLTELLRGSSTDVRFIYNAASWSWITLFRPFLWGYLLGGFDFGLSFFWNARLFTLLLITFECVNLFVKKRSLSLFVALLITFSPAVQWWGTGEILIFGQCLVVSLNRWLFSKKRICRALTSGVLVWLCGCYLFTLYPAWMVPFFYIFLFMGLLQIVEFRRMQKSESFDYLSISRKDWVILIAFIAAVVALILLIFSLSAEAISASASTVYPGSRLETGGGGLFALLNYGAPLFYAITDAPFLANCENANVLSFFPLGTGSALCAILIKKRRDPLLPLVLLQLYFIWYTIFGVPELISRLTLFYTVPSIRMLLPIGYLELILLAFSLHAFSETGHEQNAEKDTQCQSMVRRITFASIVLIVTFLVALIGSHFIHAEYMRLLFILLLLIALAALSLTICVAYKTSTRISARLLCLCGVSIGLIPGLCINPIQIGTGAIENPEIRTEVENVLQDDSQSLWIGEGRHIMLPNLLAGYGAPTLNSTNAYPNLRMWERIDPSGQYEHVYNRYAHIEISLTDDETTFELIQQDVFLINLSVEDAELLGIKYLVTDKVYETGDYNHLSFTQLGEADGFYIYRLDYN